MEGGRHERERFKVPVAVHLFLVRDGRVLLLQRCNTGYEDGNYSVVAGHLDGGEAVRAAAAREAWEEAGVRLSPDDLGVVGVMHRRGTDDAGTAERVDFFLETSRWLGDVTNAEPAKCDELSWFPLDHLPDNVVPYVRRALDNYRRGVWFDSFGWEAATQE